jgi:predicted nucleic acid-binding protein
MPFVLDASVTLCWALHDEGDPRADAALERLQYDRPIVPGIWWYEIRNILRVNERRGRIQPEASEQFLASLDPLGIPIVFPHESRKTLHLARRHNQSVYDAAYLHLALSEDLPLATLDHALAQAAHAEGVALIG